MQTSPDLLALGARHDAEYALCPAEISTTERIEQLVDLANPYPVVVAVKPRANAQSVKAALRRERARRGPLVDVLSRAGEDGLDSVLDRIRQHEARIKDRTEQIREAEASNEVPPSIDKADVEPILGNVPTCERVAPMAAELAGRGASVNTIGTALNTSWMTVQ